MISAGKYAVYEDRDGNFDVHSSFCIEDIFFRDSIKVTSEKTLLTESLMTSIRRNHRCESVIAFIYDGYWHRESIT